MNNNWRNLKLRGDILRPFVRAVGNNVNAGLLAGAVHFPLAYFLFNHIGTKNGVPNPERNAAALSGITSALLGGATWYGLKRRGKPYENGDDFADTILGAPDQGWGGGSIKLSSEPFSFDKGSLIQGVEEMPITDSQRSFLNKGISYAPGRYQTTLWGLGDGFSNAIDHNTGGLLGYATRAAEGALIGGAFGSLLGLSPQHKQWARGIGAVCDALQGSKLFNAIGELL